MADLGTDIAGVTDVTPSLATVSGRRNLIQAIARRLITPRGGLFYDETYGYDVRQFLSGIVRSTSVIAAGIVEQAEQDERVDQADADVTFSGDQLVIKVSISDGFGPFSFVLAISKVTVELLTQG